MDSEDFDRSVSILLDSEKILGKHYGEDHVIMSYPYSALGGAYYLKGDI